MRTICGGDWKKKKNGSLNQRETYCLLREKENRKEGVACTDGGGIVSGAELE